MSLNRPGHLGVPPAGAVRWTVSNRRSGEKLGTVVAPTWFAARRRALAEFQLEMHEIDVQLENGDGLR